LEYWPVISYIKGWQLKRAGLFAEKYYYTPGKYFSMDKMSGSMPAGTKMIEVYGSSRVLEVPLRLRYDLSLKKKHRVFSSAGVSSFVLTKKTISITQCSMEQKETCWVIIKRTSFI
jgi:hypothetical protein